VGKLENNIIHCIGDSHVCFFAGNNGAVHPYWPNYIGDNPPFKTYHLGPILAYNLCSLNTTTKGRELLLFLLRLIPKKSNLLLIYGEIDCRAHLGKQSDLQRREIEDIVQECVDKYFKVILEIKNMDFNVGVWGVIPSTNIPCDYGPDHPFPSYGTCQQRNITTRLFNNYLNELCCQENIIFVSIFEELLNPNLTANIDYYMDVNHLSQRSFSIALEKIKVAYGII